MAAVAAANESALQAAAALEPAAAAADARPLATLDPRLLMAARRGDSKALKDLLQLKDQDGNDDQQDEDTRPDVEGSGTPTTATAASTTTSVAAAPPMSQPHVIVEVDPRRPHDATAAAPLPPAAGPVLDDDGVTIDTEGASLLVHSETVEQVVEPPPPGDDDDAPPARQLPAASFPAAVPVLLDEDGVTIEGDSLLHVVAACGDTPNFLDCVDVIVRNKEKKVGAAAAAAAAKRRALEARNNKGDTPLHCAARAGNANMISRLVALMSNAAAATDEELAVKTAFLRMQNYCGETALHQAVRAVDNKVACIDQLMDEDSELACIPYEDEGASPLYLAIRSLDDMEIARHLYAKSKGKLSYSGPDGRNVLHAAVSRGQVLFSTVLEWLKDMKTVNDDIHIHREGAVEDMTRRSDDLLLSRLTNQRDKQQNGSTPLHLAASLGGWPDARFLSTWFPQVWAAPEAAATLLLDANLSTAYQADDRGWYPIHVGAHAGSLGVVSTLLERCPDCATMRDVKGRTFLHVAVEKERHAVVRCAVCGEMPQHLSRAILNAQDNDGDTALHGAVRAGKLAVFNLLLRNPRVRLDVANKDGMTPLDLSLTMFPEGFYDKFNPRSIVRMSLVHAGAPHGGARVDLFTEKHIPKRNIVEESKKHTEATQVMSIVTALIATVTFASAFTLPGGYRADDDNGKNNAAAGTPLLAGRYAFHAFVLADTLAFICSMAATCFLVYTGLPTMDISIRNRYFIVSGALLQSSARSLVAAFGLALYLVLAPVHHATAVVVCVITFASSIYGNMVAWQVICMANTVRARIGMRRLVLRSNLAAIPIIVVMEHFGSYIIIFGLPAIWKLAR